MARSPTVVGGIAMASGILRPIPYPVGVRVLGVCLGVLTFVIIYFWRPDLKIHKQTGPDRPVLRDHFLLMVCHPSGHRLRR